MNAPSRLQIWPDRVSKDPRKIQENFRDIVTCLENNRAGNLTLAQLPADNDFRRNALSDLENLVHEVRLLCHGFGKSIDKIRAMPSSVVGEL